MSLVYYIFETQCTFWPWGNISVSWPHRLSLSSKWFNRSNKTADNYFCSTLPWHQCAPK